MKKYLIILSVLSLFAFIMFNACDKIEPPYKNTTPPPVKGDTIRKILLEEYTGHTCPNCPAGTALAHQLKSLYGVELILMSIHAGDLAYPGSGEFALDLRSPVGNELNSFFNVQYNPSGTISRTLYNTPNFILDPNAWASRIETIEDSLPIALLRISNSFNSGTSTLQSVISCKALQDLNPKYKLSVYIVEDSIIGAQDSMSTVIHNYVFMDVLRGSMNGTWGEKLSAGTTLAGDSVSKTYSMALNPAWNPDHCSVIAFMSDSTNYEIYQAEEKKIK